MILDEDTVRDIVTEYLLNWCDISPAMCANEFDDWYYNQINSYAVAEVPTNSNLVDLSSLGLDLWEHDGDRWLIPLEGGDNGGRYIMRLSDHSVLWADSSTSADPFDRALAAYLAAHTPPARPKPGERWLLSMDLGSVEQPVEVVEIGRVAYFAWQDGMTPMLVRVADRHPSTYRRNDTKEDR